MTTAAFAVFITAMLVGFGAPLLMFSGVVKSVSGRLALWGLVTLAGVVIWALSERLARG
jgi:hypothetical protein